MFFERSTMPMIRAMRIFAIRRMAEFESVFCWIEEWDLRMR
jgi:hypothetical protein